MSQEIKLAKILEKDYNCRIIINEEENKCFFCLRDIGKILNVQNMSNRQINIKDKISIKIKTNGGEQNMIFINYNYLLKIFSTTRRTEIIDLANNLGLNINNYIYSCIEADTLKCILDAFNGEKMIKQYIVKQYFIDLYFPEYNLAIECDENRHNRKLIKENDIDREINIKIEIKGIHFIRYEPFKKDFSIFNVINKIYKYIIEVKY